MKVLVDLTSLYFHLTGVERYAANITEHFIAAHPEDQYILLFANEVHADFMRYAEHNSIQLVKIPCRNRFWFSQIRLAKVISSIKADVYYFPALCAPWLLLKRNTVEVIHDLSDFECCDGKGLLRTLYCRMGILRTISRAARLITVSQFSRQRICQYFKIPEKRVVIAYDGITAGKTEEKTPWETIQRKYRIPDCYLLTVSTLEPRKNIYLLLNAFQEIAREDSTVSLVICGRAGWNNKETFGIQQENCNRIVVTGFIEDEDLPSIYRHAEAFVFPSKYEGFGLPPLEAMSQGCPVVSSDAASMPEVLGEAAVYFKSNQKESLLSALRRILSMDAEQRESLQRAGIHRAENFTWSSAAETTHRALKEVALSKY